MSANNLLFLMVAAMLSTLLVSGFVSRLCLAALELDFQVPEHVSARRAVPGKLFVRNQKWLMPSFSIRVEGIRDPASPTLQSDVYFPLIAGGALLEETVEVRFPGARRLPPEQFRLLHVVPVRLPGKIGAGHPAARYDRVPLDRSAARLRRPAAGHRRRDRNPLPRAGPRLLSHSSLRGPGERAARGLESLRARGQPAGPRVRPRAGADGGTVPGPRHSRPTWTPGSSTPWSAARSWPGGSARRARPSISAPTASISASRRTATSIRF